MKIKTKERQIMLLVLIIAICSAVIPTVVAGSTNNNAKYTTLVITTKNLQDLQNNYYIESPVYKNQWLLVYYPNILNVDSSRVKPSPIVNKNKQSTGRNGVMVADLSKTPKYWGECVSLVKTLSGNNAQTSQWVPGTNVLSAKILAPGTVIATFTNGKYASKSGESHAAIVAGYDGKGTLWVFDQNYVQKGLVGFHSLPKGGHGEHYANDYYIVTIKNTN